MLKYSNILKSMILLAVISLAITAACQNTAESGDGRNGDGYSDGLDNDTFSNESEEEQEPVKILPNLPDVYYDGYQFTILSMSNEDGVWDDFFAAEQTGEIINDAIYLRNTYVEDKYGIRVNTVNTGHANMGSGIAALRRTVAAGDYDYSAAVLSAYDASAGVLEGLLMDLNSMPHLDLSRPWWDQRANEDLEIKGRMFFTTGDISRAMSDSVWVILFNKKLVQEYGITEDLYQLVQSGSWTWDKLSELSRMVSEDLNGDGEMNENDRFGLITADDIMQCLINTIGEKSAVINREGYIELSLYNERTISVFNKLSDLIWDETVVFHLQRVPSASGESMFENDRALFIPTGTRMIAAMRSMETNFGILPMPKLDELQSSYFNPIITWWSVFLCAPVLQEDAERTAVILEALAAESKYTLRPAYYERSLIGQHVRDYESEEMLDIIFATRIYDLGWYYQIGGYDMGMINIMRERRGDFASTFERSLTRAERDIQRINDLFGEFIY